MNILYYFDKNLIEYQVIAHMEAELLDELVQLILVLNEKGLLKNIITIFFNFIFPTFYRIFFIY